MTEYMGDMGDMGVLTFHFYGIRALEMEISTNGNLMIQLLSPCKFESQCENDSKSS